MTYNEFIAQHKDFAKDLYDTYKSCSDGLVCSNEDALYNLGVNERDADNPVKGNIVLANAKLFNLALMRYKLQSPNMDDVEAKSRVIFDFLQKNGQDFSYEKNADDVLWGDVTRKMFYGLSKDGVFDEIVGNTNFKDRHIGNMQIIALPEVKSDMPRGADELLAEVKASGISSEEWNEIMLKRGLYHEAIHASCGTTDERKCDAFALLKIMKEHPQYAKTAFDVYNYARSKIGHTVGEIHQVRNSEFDMQRKVKGGAMTYMMPETYEKLKEYALNPSKIPSSDTDIFKLAWRITSEPDFSKEQLQEFHSVVCQDKISKKALSECSIVKACMKQGGFKSIEEYIQSDKALCDIMSKKGIDDLDKAPKSEEKGLQRVDFGKEM